MIQSNLFLEYPNTDDCFVLEKQIQGLKTDIDYFTQNGDINNASKREALLKFRNTQFEIEGCLNVIQSKRNLDTKQVFDKFASEAEKRIVLDSKKTRNTLIAISGFTLIAAIILIIKINKK